MPDTSRDTAISDPLDAALDRVSAATGFPALLAARTVPAAVVVRSPRVTAATCVRGGGSGAARGGDSSIPSGCEHGRRSRKKVDGSLLPHRDDSSHRPPHGCRTASPGDLHRWSGLHRANERGSRADVLRPPAQQALTPQHLPGRDQDPDPTRATARHPCLIIRIRAGESSVCRVPPADGESIRFVLTEEARLVLEAQERASELGRLPSGALLHHCSSSKAKPEAGPGDVRAGRRS